ncbi:MAG: hypothetical protein KF684_05565 [Phycisphaeraceae bacterium]|nr:hypothetical protein [Phycisphaeraceae bacterium]
MNATRMVRAGSAFVAAVSLTSLAGAVPLPPGSTNVPLAGTTVAAEPALATVNVATSVQSFSITGPGGAPLLFQGQISLSVERSVVTNTLVFSHRIFNTQPGLNGSVARVEISEHSGSGANVNWRLDGLGTTGPSRASRAYTGGTIEFDFANPLLFSGVASRFFYVFTDAAEYNDHGSVAIILNTGDFVVLPAFAPGRPCPSCRGDVNRDGVVNFSDLNEVLSAFGTTCPPPSVP